MMMMMMMIMMILMIMVMVKNSDVAVANDDFGGLDGDKGDGVDGDDQALCWLFFLLLWF